MIILNNQQEFVVNEAVKWFRYSSEQYFSVVGYAGTGKSVVIAEIINRLGLAVDEVLPIAYTGQACTIMRTKGFLTASTCHSSLYHPRKVKLRDKYGNIIYDKEFNVPKIKWVYDKRDFDDSKIKLIVLDEAWMAPAEIRHRLDEIGIKVLAAGDPGQLPPITGNPAFLCDGIIHQLTELMRQSENSPIVYLANRARNGEFIHPGMYGNSVCVLYKDEITDDILSRSNIILCAKNDTRDKLNNKIRHDILHKYTRYPEFGERVICRKNNWDYTIGNISLVNGLVGTVVSVPDASRMGKNSMEIDFLPDLSPVRFNNLRIDTKYLNLDYSGRKENRNSPYSTGEKFEYAYASTVHLAQGSEYLAGMYIEESMGPNLVNAMNYTAITRFKQQMIYAVHIPKFWCGFDNLKGKF